MRLALLTSLVASFLLGAFSAACGGGEQPCCPDNFCSDVDADCVDGVCVVSVPGKGACEGMGTKRGEPCCKLTCIGDTLSCSEGTCVDINDVPVLDQSGPQEGQLGGKCIGEDQICDESDEFSLECINGICEDTTPVGVTDQSVCPSPEVSCSYSFCVCWLL